MLKSFLNKIVAKGKLIAAGSAMALTAVGSAIVASADDGSSSTSTVSTIISDAGATLITQFTNLATAVIPVIISIAVVGLGIYAVVYLFNMAKSFFKKAAG